MAFMAYREAKFLGRLTNFSDDEKEELLGS
jgi:hypothetical protein